MKKKIAVIAGGDSSEEVVSVKSAGGIISFLDKDRYDVYLVLIKKGEWLLRGENGESYPIDKNDFSAATEDGKIIFDFAYITIHGTPGENGVLQGYFDLIGLPYSCCGVFAASLTFNKYFCNTMLQGFGIPLAESILLRKNDTFSA